MLRLIWMTSLVLAAVAVLTVLLLVVGRVVGGWTAKRYQRRRAMLVTKILSSLEETSPTQELLDLLRRHRSMATGVFTEIFELVRGLDQQRLAALAETSGIPQHLQSMLRQGSVPARLQAAETLVWFPSRESRAVLFEALSDRNDDVSLAAATCLADWHIEIPIAQLLEARKDRIGRSSLRLEALLARIAPRQTDDVLKIVADLAKPERVRVAAIDALARAKSFDLVGPLCTYASDPTAAVRAAVARGLGILGHPAAEGAVASLLGDSDWQVRADAAEAAGRISLVSLVEALSDLLADDNWLVRFRAGEALAVLGPEGLASLRRLVLSQADVPRRMAGLILAERGLA